jgi:hypothetical protein
MKTRYRVDWRERSSFARGDGGQGAGRAGRTGAAGLRIPGRNSARYTGGDIAARCPYQEKVNRGQIRSSQDWVSQTCRRWLPIVQKCAFAQSGQCDLFWKQTKCNESLTHSLPLVRPSRACRFAPIPFAASQAAQVDSSQSYTQRTSRLPIRYLKHLFVVNGQPCAPRFWGDWKDWSFPRGFARYYSLFQCRNGI